MSLECFCIYLSFLGETYRFGYQYVGCVTLITKIPPLIIFQTNLIGQVVCVCLDEALDGMDEAGNTAYTPDHKYGDVEEDLMPQELSPQQLEME